MHLSFSSKSDIGLVRKVNQDRYGHIHRDWGDLFVVADGLGHENGGQFASQTVVDLLEKGFSRCNPVEVPDFLRQSIADANDLVFNQKINKYDNAMMGTTCVAMVIQDSLAYVAHVGDSRAYYLHNRELLQLTKDHSLVQRMVDTKLISERQAETHPNKNVLTRAIGAEAEVDVDINPEAIDLSSGDRFLLCSDGLWGTVSRHELNGILGRDNPDVATQELIDLAKENGGYDNITALVIHIVE